MQSAAPSTSRSSAFEMMSSSWSIYPWSSEETVDLVTFGSHSETVPSCCHSLASTFFSGTRRRYFLAVFGERQTEPQRCSDVSIEHSTNVSPWSNDNHTHMTETSIHLALVNPGTAGQQRATTGVLGLMTTNCACLTRFNIELFLFSPNLNSTQLA